MGCATDLFAILVGYLPPLPYYHSALKEGLFIAQRRKKWYILGNQALPCGHVHTRQHKALIRTLKLFRCYSSVVGSPALDNHSALSRCVILHVVFAQLSPKREESYSTCSPEQLFEKQKYQ